MQFRDYLCLGVLFFLVMPMAAILFHRANQKKIASRQGTPAAVVAVRRVGEWIDFGGYDILVHHLCEQVHSPERILYAEVEYRNRSKLEHVHCMVRQWQLFTEEGYRYEVQPDGHQRYQRKHYFGTECFIRPGMNARGWLAFRVPEGARPALLQFMIDYLHPKTAEIRVEDVEQEAPEVEELPYGRGREMPAWELAARRNGEYPRGK